MVAADRRPDNRAAARTARTAPTSQPPLSRCGGYAIDGKGCMVSTLPMKPAETFIVSRDDEIYEAWLQP